MLSSIFPGMAIRQVNYSMENAIPLMIYTLFFWIMQCLISCTIYLFSNQSRESGLLLNW